MHVKKLIQLGVLLASITAVPLQGAVENAAWLQGNTLDNGTSNLAAALGSELTIQWTSVSSIDGRAYEHSFSSPSSLVVQQNGDYFVAFNAPITVDSAVQRPTQLFQVYVNDEPVETALTQSTYLRNAPQHQEVSGHFATLLPGLSSGDSISVKTARTAQNTGSTRLEMASLYVELIDDSQTAFFAKTTETVGGPDVNRDASENDRELIWNSVRSDSGITHSSGSHEIGLSSGNYLVFVNVPIQGFNNRVSPGLEIMLDGVLVNNGIAEQGYIRNTGGHNASSLHWSGMVNVSGNQTLEIGTVLRAATGEVTIPANQPGNIFIHKLPSTDGVFSEALIDDFFDFNLPDPTPLPWNDPSNVIDTSVYSHSDFESDITVREDGSYLVVYNDDLENGNARANPIVKINVNGTPVPGAELKSHYIRQTSGHITASGSMVFLLDNLEANDVISITTQREMQGGLVFGLLNNAGAIVTIVKKNSFTPDPASGLPPRVNLFHGDVSGFTLQITDQGASVQTDSVEIMVNGEAIEADLDKSGVFTTISYKYPIFPDTGSEQVVTYSFNDDAGNSFSNELSYTISTQFERLIPELAVEGVNTSLSGFRATVTQLTDPDDGTDVHGNTDAGVELQLAGIHPQTGEPYVNEADPSQHDIETVINWEQAAGIAGNFTFDTGHADDFIPGIPGTTALTDGIAVEILTYLDLEAGMHTFGVNSDDGFKVTSGRNPKDLLGIRLGMFEGGRGSADTLFDVAVDKSGFYPVRLIWYEGTGGASVEFFSVTDEGEKVLINDNTNPNSIKAYRQGPSLPYISRLDSPDRKLSSVFEADITDGNIGIVDGSIKLLIDGRDVTPEISKSGNVTTVSFDNGEFFSGGDHTFILSYDEASSPPFTRTAVHNFSVPKGQVVILQDRPDVYITMGDSDGISVFSSIGEADGGAELTATLAGNPLPMVVERLVPGAAEGAIRLEKDSGQSIAIPNGPGMNNVPGNPGVTDRTYEFWFQATDVPPTGRENRQIIFEEGGTTRGLSIYLDGTQDNDPTEANLYLLMWNAAETPWGGTAGPIVDGSTAISTTIQEGETYHLAYVLANGSDDLTGTLTGYLNGQQIGQVGGIGRFFNHTDAIGFGQGKAETAFHDGITPGAEVGTLPTFDGIIDEFAVFSNRALTAAEILNHYETGLVEVPPHDGGGGGDGGMFTGISMSDGQVTIEWEGVGTLQSASSVDGPFANVPNASSPFIVDTSAGGNTFYRLSN